MEGKCHNLNNALLIMVKIYFDIFLQAEFTFKKSEIRDDFHYVPYLIS